MSKHMEILSKIPSLGSREAFIKAVYADTKGREVDSPNSFTCYVAIDSPTPNLGILTASMLDVIYGNIQNAYVWAAGWDKSIISIAPNNQLACVLLSDDDPAAKNFAPVSTTKTVDKFGLIKNLPDGDLAVIKINDKPMTIDAFLIVYFHMVNELIWSLTRVFQSLGQIQTKGYSAAVNQVMDRGYGVILACEEEIIQEKIQNSNISMRIYGSKVNPYVPQIMGTVNKI